MTKLMQRVKQIRMDMIQTLMAYLMRDSLTIFLLNHRGTIPYWLFHNSYSFHQQIPSIICVPVCMYACVDVCVGACMCACLFSSLLVLFTLNINRKLP